MVGGARGGDAKRHLIGDADAVAFERHDFFRMVRQDANILEPEINQNLSADTALMLNHALASGFAVELAACVKMDARRRGGLEFRRFDGEAPPGVMEIEEHAAVLARDSFERKSDQLAAIAGG